MVVFLAKFVCYVLFRGRHANPFPTSVYGSQELGSHWATDQNKPRKLFKLTEKNLRHSPISVPCCQLSLPPAHLTERSSVSTSPCSVVQIHRGYSKVWTRQIKRHLSFGSVHFWKTKMSFSIVQETKIWNGIKNYRTIILIRDARLRKYIWVFLLFSSITAGRFHRRNCRVWKWIR